MKETKPDNTNNMKDSDKITLLMDVIKRYDNYIVSTNAKASLIIAFNTLILGAVLLKFNDIISFYCSPINGDAIGFLLILLSASSLFSLIFVFHVVYPYFGKKSAEKQQRNSLIYFGSVSGMSGLEYFENLDRVTIEELIADLSLQAVILADGLRTKMLSMRRSVETITVSLILILILVMIKVVNYLCCK